MLKWWSRSPGLTVPRYVNVQTLPVCGERRPPVRLLLIAAVMFLGSWCWTVLPRFPGADSVNIPSALGQTSQHSRALGRTKPPQGGDGRICCVDPFRTEQQTRGDRPIPATSCLWRQEEAPAAIPLPSDPEEAGSAPLLQAQSTGPDL